MFYQRPYMRHATRRTPYDPAIRSGLDLTLCLLFLGALLECTWVMDAIIRGLTYLFK
jgi:hypothetical protein